MADPHLFELSDLATPWALHVAATLRVAEHIEAGVTRVEDLALACRADADALCRLLRHLASRGVFEEPAPGVFALNALGRQFLEPGLRLGLDLDSFGGRMAGCWNTLLECVRTGKPAYGKVFGQSFWDDLTANPAMSADFDALMGPAGHGIPDADIPLSSGWDNIRFVVDVGGGTGALLAAILRAHPAVRGILVDKPETAARADFAGLKGRVVALGQSFFQSLPVGADVYFLKSVLSDWPDAEAEAILRRCAEAAQPSDGRVVILNGIAAGDRPNPDLLMLVLVGGKERTLAEFRALAARAGLEVAQTTLQPSGRFVVECRTSR